jgi:hypothetical protein
MPQLVRAASITDYLPTAAMTLGLTLGAVAGAIALAGRRET